VWVGAGSCFWPCWLRRGCKKAPSKEKGECQCGLVQVVVSGMLAGEGCRKVPTKENLVQAVVSGMLAWEGFRKVSTKEEGEWGVGAASCLACWLGRSAERYQPKRKESVVWGWCS